MLTVERAIAAKSRKRAVRALIALLLAGAGFGCDGGPTAPGGKPGETPTPVARVELSRADMTLGAGDTVQLQATARGSAGEPLSGRAIEWSSSNPAVAAVSATGMLRALAPGAAVIAATSEGQRGSLIVTVLPAPAVRVAGAPTTVAMNAESGFGFTVQVFDAAEAPVAAPNLSARSGDTTVATVAARSSTSSIELWGVREGTTTITVRALNAPGLTPEFVEVTVPLTVGPVLAGRVELTPISASVAVGDSVPFAAATFAGSGRPLPGRPVSWRSSDTTIAAVSQSGWVRGVAPGAALVTVLADGRLDSSAVTVTPATGPIPSLAIIPAEASLLPGGQLSLGVAFDPPIVPQPQVTWRSSDSSTVSVSAAGVATAHTTGVATIFATAGGLTARALIMVGEVPVTRIAVSLERAILTLANSTRASATLYDAAGRVLPMRPLTWSSSDRTIATVGEDGMVTAVSPGTVAITASTGSASGSATLTVLPGDGSPPEIVGVSFAPLQVDVTSDAATVTASVRLRDAGAGIDSSRTVVTLSTTRGTASCFARTLVSGTRNDGTWQCTLRIPQGARPGQWALSGLFAQDLALNASSLSAEEAARLSAGVTVANANADVTPPTVTSVTFSPPTVDITGRAATTTIIVAASDAGSGVTVVSNNYVTIESPAGERAGCFVRTLVSGTPRDGRWSCTVTIPEWSRVGPWFVRSVELYDAEYNVRFLEGEALRAVADTLTVTGPAPDVTAPSIGSVSISPTTVQKNAPGAAVTVTFTATDDLRGVDPTRSFVVLRSPSSASPRACSRTELVSGTATNGTWRCTIAFYFTDELGTWTLDQVTLQDIVGNKRELLGAEARALFPGGIVVQP